MWIWLDGIDAGQDAIYVHTPNPNGAAFPARFGGQPIDWRDGTDPDLRRLLPEWPLRVGRLAGRSGVSWLIYSPRHGDSLEEERPPASTEEPSPPASNRAA